MLRSASKVLGEEEFMKAIIGSVPLGRMGNPRPSVRHKLGDPQLNSRELDLTYSI
jgi:hypothetical protein